MDLTTLAAAFDADGTALIRTDFSDDRAWQTVIDRASEPVDLDDPSGPNIVAIDDRALEGATGPALGRAAAAAGQLRGYALLADTRSMSEAASGGELTLDYVDLSPYTVEDPELFKTFPGRTFRCEVSEIESIEVNLDIANMDFSDFADNTDPDGVFRGFS